MKEIMRNRTHFFYNKMLKRLENKIKKIIKKIKKVKKLGRGEEGVETNAKCYRKIPVLDGKTSSV